MSISLTKFVTHPGNIENKSDKTLKNVNVKDIIKLDESFLINFLVKSFTDPKVTYISSIVVSDMELNPRTTCKFLCTCPHFKFKYATILYRNNALIGEPDSNKLPQNPKIYICKHLENALTFLLRNKNQFISKLKGVKDG